MSELRESIKTILEDDCGMPIDVVVSNLMELFAKSQETIVQLKSLLDEPEKEVMQRPCDNCYHQHREDKNLCSTCYGWRFFIPKHEPLEGCSKCSR